MGNHQCFKACHCCVFIGFEKGAICTLTKELVNTDGSCDEFCCIDCKKGRDKAEETRSRYAENNTTERCRKDNRAH